ncbi:MAG: hypothetical protein SPE05_06040 [Bacteroidales bacterium]|nr:hypothetical protein [Bacteroidales bacterium]MDY4520909.1 hypothetical protein [Bacteroidales bacterium]
MKVDVPALVNRWGLWAVFVLSFLSSTLLPGVSEVSLTALIAAGLCRFWPLFFTATIGNWLGSVFTFATGWLFGNQELYAWLGLEATEVASVMDWVSEWGVWAGLAVWVPIVGDPLAAALGLAHTPAVATCTTILIGKAVRYAVIMGLVQKITDLFKERKKGDKKEENGQDSQDGNEKDLQEKVMG